MSSEQKWKSVRRAWTDTPPGRFIGGGHPIGDFLEASQWELREEREGYVKVYAHLPLHVRNLRGQLFGGFTGTYIDFVSLYTARAGRDRAERWDFFLATVNMRIDYFEPITDPGFTIESHLAVFALTTMKKMPL